MIERADRVLVEGRHEDHGRCVLGRGAEYLEAVGSGKLHVEEDQVRVPGANETDRLRARLRLAHEREVRLGRDQLHDPPAGERFVIHDEHAERPDRLCACQALPFPARQKRTSRRAH
jgi:hypothetical protein